MTVEMDNTDKLRLLFEDARKLGMAFEPPDINRGVHRFEPVNDKLIRYGLGAIKGTGQQAIESIVAARADGGPFTSLFDFCVRVDRTRLNKRCLEALIKAGAFDNLHRNRAALVASIDLAFDFAATTEANANQGGLFDMGGEDDHGSSAREPDLVDAALGRQGAADAGEDGDRLLPVGPPVRRGRAEVRRFAKRQIDDLIDTREPQLLAGIVNDFARHQRPARQAGLFKLDDKSA
jgi:DNA polymerase-3 subunit alpha